MIKVKFKKWWYWLNIRNIKNRIAVNKLTKQIYEENKSEINKVILDQVIYGTGSYRTSVEGKILHIPYKEALKGQWND